MSPGVTSSTKASYNAGEITSEIAYPLGGHAPQARVVDASSRVERRPHGDVDGLALRYAVVLEQRLRVLPARQHADLDRAEPRAEIHLGDVGQVVAGAVAEDRPLHVRRLDLAPVQHELALRRDDGLRDVEAVRGAALREPERYGDRVLLGCRFDRFHFLSF